MKIASEGSPVETKIIGRYTFEDLDERLIEEVARRVNGVRTLYLTNQAAVAMKGIIKSPFAPWIEKEKRPKDFNPPILEK